jgi:hypothetical protein
MKFKITALFIALSIFWGCNNEIELNAPYRNIAVVYSFLDQNEPLQILRIQKAFQNDKGVTVVDAARNADSLYFDTLVVTLKNLATNIVYNCVAVDTISRDSGFFGTQKNINYVVALPKNANIADEEYELTILNPLTRETYKSRTKIVKDAEIEGRTIFLNLDPRSFIPFRFIQGRNAIIHDCAIRFEYSETDLITGVTEDKSLEFFIVKNQEINNQGALVDFRVQALTLINFWKSQIPENPNKQRRYKAYRYIVYGGGADFKILLDLAKPNTGIVQKKPEFSNIEGGLGIFTSRNRVVSDTALVGLSNTSIDLLVQELPNFVR